MNMIMDGITSLQDRVSRSMDINTSTLSGAIDVIVVEQEDGSLTVPGYSFAVAQLS